MKHYENEEWKPVKDYEGLYEVSNLGRIKSLPRKIIRTIGSCISKEKILKKANHNCGYDIVTLRKDNKGKARTVHQLVAESFLNHKACNYAFVINHIDFNKKNNNVKNLEVVTNRENSNHKHIKSSSKYTGVCWSKIERKWMSSIYINGKHKRLGLFKNEYDAHLAYENKLKSL